MVRYLDIEDYDLKYANTLELLILLVSAKSRLDGSIDFCGSLIYKIQTYSESYQYFEELDLLILTYCI